MKPLLLALCLALGSPAMLHRAPAEPLGALVREFRTIDGTIAAYREGDGCVLLWRGVEVDRVSLAVCEA